MNKRLKSLTEYDSTTGEILRLGKVERSFGMEINGVKWLNYRWFNGGKYIPGEKTIEAVTA